MQILVILYFFSNTKICFVLTNINVLAKLSLPIFPGYTKPPLDLNNDGLYEDINGNGRLDFADVVTYYNNLAWITQNGLIPYFDYNHNGRIDFNDVVKLYNMHWGDQVWKEWGFIKN